MNISLKDYVIFVRGGSEGIAREISQCGGKVFFVNRDEDETRSVVESITNEGGKAS